MSIELTLSNLAVGLWATLAAYQAWKFEKDLVIPMLALLTWGCVGLKFIIG